VIAAIVVTAIKSVRRAGTVLPAFYFELLCVMLTLNN
jgi:hypothetical protein